MHVFTNIKSFIKALESFPHWHRLCKASCWPLQAFFITETIWCQVWGTFSPNRKRGPALRAVVHYLTKSFNFLLLRLCFPQANPVANQRPLFSFPSVPTSFFLCLFKGIDYKLSIYWITFVTVRPMMQARILKSHLDRGVNTAGLRERWHGIHRAGREGRLFACPLNSIGTYHCES